MENYYVLFGINKSASKEEIDKAYRRLCKAYHPDSGATDDEMIKKINEAYRVLSDPIIRAEYDSSASTGYAYSSHDSSYSTNSNAYSNNQSTYNQNAGADPATTLKRAFIFLEDGNWSRAGEFFARVLNEEPDNARAYLGRLLCELRVKSASDLKNQREPFESNSYYQKCIRFADADLRKQLEGYTEYIKERNLSETYLSAQKILDNRNSSEQELRKAAEIFQSISYYRDSKNKAKLCLQRAEEKRRDVISNQAVLLMNSTDIADCEKALDLLNQVAEWKEVEEEKHRCFQRILELREKKEAEEREKERILREKEEAEKERVKKKKRKTRIIAAAVIAVVAIVLLVTKVIIPNQNYNAAIALKDAGKYDEAITAFEAMNGYKDSIVQIEACQTALKDIAYNAAATLKDAGQYEEAITAFEALKGYKDSIVQIEACQTAIKDIEYNAAVALKDAGKYEEAITAFKAMNGYKDSIVQIEACQTAIKDIKYNAAVALKDAGKYEEAITAFKAMNGYKDSAERVAELELEKLKMASVGDKVYFGTYEQDNDTTNGKEDIEWHVLDRQDNKILLISKKALAYEPYDFEWTYVTWETCTLRNWLNSEFINTAFSEEEQKRISQTRVTADMNPDHRTNPGNNTMDKVFLLSISEAKKYFVSNQARQCVPTAYALASAGDVASCWWLRSTGRRQDYAAYVDDVGFVYSSGFIVNYFDRYVRPALWIDLES